MSGPNAAECVAKIFHPNEEQGDSPPFPCVIAGRIRFPAYPSPLPCDAYYWSNRSYTGQPVVEIPRSVRRRFWQMLLGTICSAGARLAAPGEFTLRAFLAGRIDLGPGRGRLGRDERTSREFAGRPGPVGRRTCPAFAPAARRSARPARPSRSGLRLGRRRTPVSRSQSFGPASRSSRGKHSHDSPADGLARQDRRVRTRVVLVGQPNTGKSSLFNALAHGQAAVGLGLPRHDAGLSRRRTRSRRG